MSKECVCVLQYISLMFGFIFQFNTNKTEFTTIKTLCCNEISSVVSE